MRKPTIQERVHIDFKKELDMITLERIKKDLEIEKIPISEVTRMILNTEHWNDIKEELITKPRRKNE